MNTVNEFYDHEYNTLTRVSNENAIFDAWRDDSEAARKSLTCHLNLHYGERDRETLDIFPAQDSTRWLIFIHGGYWRVMTKEYSSFIAPPLVQSGLNVAVIEYDLCPEVTIETITEQCRQCIAWLQKNASDYGAACEEMIISGHSAGGHLTAMMFATDWQQYSMSADVIIGGIAISGLFDLEPLTQTRMNADLRLDSASAKALSPIHNPPQIDVPLVVALGELESSEFHRQCHLIKGAPGWQTIATDMIDVPNCHHFNILEPFMNRTGSMWDAIP